jgi:voltage-gated potassium channel
LFYYFSLVTLTTMGYGDVAPVRPPATVLVTLEAIFGQFYLAVVVAQLVGLRLAQAFEPKVPPSR